MTRVLRTSTNRSDRALAIAGFGLSIVSIALDLLFDLGQYAPLSKGGIVAGLVITVYGLIHDRIRSNRLSIVSSSSSPYTHPDTSKRYYVSFRLGVRGSRQAPRNTKLLVTNIQPRPSEHPYFRADYPYELRQLAQKDDREVLFQFADAWISSEGDLIFCGVQMDGRGEPEKLRMRDGEVWDVGLRAIADDTGSAEAWLRVSGVDKRLRVRRMSHRPAGF